MKTKYCIVRDFPVYRVGDDGSVWSRWHRRVGSQPRRKPGEPYRTGAGWYIHPTKWKRLELGWVNGYPSVRLRYEGRNRLVRVNRLVLEVFVGPCPRGMESCHENGKPEDCRLLNLRWDTRKGNMTDQLKHGTRQHGEKHYRARLDEELVRYIRMMAEKGYSQYYLAKELNVHVMTINCVVLRKTWAHVA